MKTSLLPAVRVPTVRQGLSFIPEETALLSHFHSRSIEEVSLSTMNENHHPQKKKCYKKGGRGEQQFSKHQRTLANIDDMENVHLEQCIRGLGCFEALDTSQKTNYREGAIEYLEDLLGRWVVSVGESQRQKHPRSFASVASGRPSTAPNNVWQRPPPSLLQEQSPRPALIPFGSYRLGVHSTMSDLDLLALVPPTVQRSDFFSSFVEVLRKDEKCRQVHPIPTAYTPVIKFQFDYGGDTTLPVDLLFCRVADSSKLLEYQRQKTTRNMEVRYLLDDSDLQDVDEAGIRSLNGVRVTQIILESVPNVPKFQTVLRAVKHWALVKGIYSNVLGFLGGVNWALLVAFVCKQHKLSSTSYILRCFFRTFSTWNWNNPVILNGTIAEVPPVTNVSLQSRAIYLPAWNPEKNPRDGLHTMPIITPAYPSMNSSYNVDLPQLRRIQDEMICVQNHFAIHKKVGIRNPYTALFQPSDFFLRHRHFLCITVSAQNEQNFVEWFRWVESKLRLLISCLETEETNAWPFAQYFNSEDPSKPFEKTFYIALRFAPGIDTINIQALPMEFLHKVNNWDMRTADMDLCVSRSTDYEMSHHHPPSDHLEKDEKSVHSEQTAPPTDDEDDDQHLQHQQEPVRPPQH